MARCYAFTRKDAPGDEIEEVAKEQGIPLKVIHITDCETAKSSPEPVTTYTLFRDGKFLTQSIQSDKKFLAPAGL